MRYNLPLSYRYISTVSSRTYNSNLFLSLIFLIFIFAWSLWNAHIIWLFKQVSKKLDVLKYLQNIFNAIPVACSVKGIASLCWSMCVTYYLERWIIRFFTLLLPLNLCNLFQTIDLLHQSLLKGISFLKSLVVNFLLWRGPGWFVFPSPGLWQRVNNYLYSYM